MAVPGAQQKIHETVLSWSGVTAHPHRFGGTEYRLGKRELGHIRKYWRGAGDSNKKENALLR